MAKKIFIAMSGGVDSSVAALLLKKQGYTCTGVYMKNWSDNFGLKGDCPWKKDQQMAERVCKKLNIPFKSYNFEKEYRSKVIEYFFDEYKSGRTPNPDVLCNREIKFGLFLKKALSEGADFIATGHYARKQLQAVSYQLSATRLQPTAYSLLKGSDNHKDQSYFLYQLNQYQLRHSLFPIGEYTKPQVRRLAEKFKLPNYDRPDSQGICFVGEINVRDFIKKRLGEKTGNIIDMQGKIIGKHKAVWFYTIGQREGIGIGGGKPYYVNDVNIKKNILIVTTNEKDLFKKEIKTNAIHWISEKEEKLPLTCEVSIRYNHNPQRAFITKQDLTCSVEFAKPQRAPTPGQSAVIYKGDICLGGGIII